MSREPSVSVLEQLPRVMPPLDPETTAPVVQHLDSRGIDLHLGDGLQRIDQGDDGLVVIAESGARLPTDLVILTIGVGPRRRSRETPGSRSTNAA